MVLPLTHLLPFLPPPPPISHSFEHVFMGEIKGEPPVVVGCHNWLKIYVEERLRLFDYKGYIHPRVRGGRVQDPLNTEQLIAVNFTWQGVEKDASTIFIGTNEPHDRVFSLFFLSLKLSNPSISLLLSNYPFA